MERTVNKGIAFLVYTNIFIAACAFALTAETFLLLKLPASANWYLPLLFCCTLFVYNLHYYVKTGTKKTGSRLAWCRSHKGLLLSLLWMSGLLIAGIVVTHFMELFFTGDSLNYGNISLFIFVPFAVLAYSHSIIPGSKKALRQQGWLKMILLSAAWSFTTTLLPVIMLMHGSTGSLSAAKLAVLFLHRFLFIAALSVLFNIKDQEEDKADGVKTIAVLLGPAKTLRYGQWFVFLTNLAASLLVLYVFGLHHPAFYAAVILPCGLLFLSYHRFRPAGEEAFFVVRYDGLMIIKALLLIFALLSFTV
ncbi:MAG: UbiA family prenyltransferase [Chitinophagaceae bacterium]|nr:UbiA family prenyltransferase [Chitinophagaceae bacterium]